MQLFFSKELGLNCLHSETFRKEVARLLDKNEIKIKD